MKNSIYYNKYQTKEKPLVEHKFTKEDYKESRVLLGDKLCTIEELIAANLSTTLQKRMLKITLNNMTESIDYYFNVKTMRKIKHTDDLFRKGLKQIKDILLNMPDSKKKKDVIHNVSPHISVIKNKFIAQRAYINDVEQETYTKKREILNKAENA